MTPKIETQRTIQNFDLDYYIPRQVELFLVDRRASGSAAGTLKFYTEKLAPFTEYCESKLITSILEVNASIIREYMLCIEAAGHNKGGQHAHYRAVRAFLRWYDLEMEPENWKNPIKKVKAPKVPQEILPPVSIETIKALLNVCNKDTFFCIRDSAILYMLFDTGLRASELLAIDRSDIDQTGAVFIHHGKGNKDRIVFIGKKTRAALRKYLKTRTDDNPALLLSRYHERLTYDGLRMIMTRRAAAANLAGPSLHSFRRAFALNMLRAGVDIHTLAKLMGHTTITVLSRYLKIDETDTRAAHNKGNPVDNLDW